MTQIQQFAAALLGRNTAVAVNNDELTLGRFQSGIFDGLDGRRTREISFQVVGEWSGPARRPSAARRASVLP